MSENDPRPRSQSVRHAADGGHGCDEEHDDGQRHLAESPRSNCGSALQPADPAESWQKKLEDRLHREEPSASGGDGDVGENSHGSCGTGGKPGFPSHYFATNHAATVTCTEENIRTLSKPGGPYYCPDCGIRFSSHATLEAHQAYYCSRRLTLTADEELTATDETSTQLYPAVRHNGSWVGVKQESTATAASELEKERDVIAAEMSSRGSHFVTRSGKAGHRTKKPGYVPLLNLHQESAAAAKMAVPPAARYCSNCDIQFTSVKTYQVHKQYYCSTRHILKPAAATAPPGANKTSAATVAPSASPSCGHGRTANSTPSPQQRHGAVATVANPKGPAGMGTSGDATASIVCAKENGMVLNPSVLSFPTSPVILLPCSYISGSGVSMLPAGAAAAGLLVPNGNLSTAAGLFPTTFAILTSPPPGGGAGSATAPLATTLSPRPTHPLATIAKPAALPPGGATIHGAKARSDSPSPTVDGATDAKGEQPLDLSVKRPSAETRTYTVAAEARRSPSSCSEASDSAGAPTLSTVSSASSAVSSATPSPTFVAAPTPSQAAIFLAPIDAPHGMQLYTHPALATRLAPPPPPPVKQGTNKCADCGIVFYKKENYLVHRRHYCARRHENSSPVEGGSDSPAADECSSPPTRRRKLDDGGAATDEADERCADAVVKVEASCLQESPPAGAEPLSKDDSRPTSKPLQRRGGGSPPGGAHGHSPPSFGVAAVAKPPNQARYACASCGILYSSLSNLQAHQTYYCLKLKEKELLLANQQHSPQQPQTALLSQQATPLLGRSSASSLSPSSKGHLAPARAPGIVCCSQCHTQFHVADAEEAVAASLNLKCPVCNMARMASLPSPTVAPPTRAAESQSLLSSSGALARAYHCTLCGYRGNTLRGMKTHIRMHLDRGGDVQEECYISCVPSMVNGDGPVGPSERPPNHVGAPPRSISSPNGIIADDDGGTTSPRSGSESCSGGATSELKTTAALHSCDYCGYTSSYKGNVVRHVRLVHKELLAAAAAVSSGSIKTEPNGSAPVASPRTCKEEDGVTSPPPIPPSSKSPATSCASSTSGTTAATAVTAAAVAAASEDSRDATSPCGSTGDATVTGSSVVTTDGATDVPVAGCVAKSPVPATTAALVAAHGRTGNGVNASRRSGSKYCKSCDISFTYLSTFIAHKKFYCASHASENLGRETPVQ